MNLSTNLLINLKHSLKYMDIQQKILGGEGCLTCHSLSTGVEFFIGNRKYALSGEEENQEETPSLFYKR